jgi:type II secretory pathway component PulF
VNVTFEPAQTVPADVVTVTDGAVVGLIVIVIPVLVAVVGEAQPELEVITQVITSLLAKAELLKVFEFVPALIPFIFH